MINIFRLLKERYNYEGYFLIAGSEKNYKFDIDHYVKDDHFIKLIGKVSDSELYKLYSKMQCLFFISKYEGFGLPIIEAAKQNKKIITSDFSSCGEIAPDTALLIKNTWTDNYIAKRCAAYLNSKYKIKNDDYLRNFSWNKSAYQIFSIK